MRFFKHFDLLNIKKINKKTKIFILYKKKIWQNAIDELKIFE